MGLLHPNIGSELTRNVIIRERVCAAADVQAVECKVCLSVKMTFYNLSPCPEGKFNMLGQGRNEDGSCFFSVAA